jgi:hypothetical protein
MNNHDQPTEPTMAAVLEAIQRSNELCQRNQEQMMPALTAMMGQLVTRPGAQPLGQNQTERQHRDPGNYRWDGAFRVEILEFIGGLSVDEFLDWITTVDEIMSLKEVPLQTNRSL